MENVAVSLTSIVWDHHNGTQIIQYKGNNATLNGTCVVADQFLLSAQKGRSMINVWRLNHATPLLKCSVPEKCVSVTSSPSGTWVFAGTETGRILGWNSSNGHLMVSTTAHFRAISCMCVTPEGSHLISAGEDAVVLVWSIPRLLSDAQEQHSTADSSLLCSWSDHTLPVTHLKCSVAPTACRVFTASSDHSIKIYDLASKQFLVSLVFPAAVNSIALNLLETKMYAACGDGHIYPVNLTGSSPTSALKLEESLSSSNLPKAPLDVLDFESWLTIGTNDDKNDTRSSTLAVSPDPSSHLQHRPTIDSQHSFRGHTGSVTSVICDDDGTIISSSTDGTCRVWDADSGQTTRVFSAMKGSVAGVLLVPKNQAASSPLSNKAPEKRKPLLSFASLRKFKEFDSHDMYSDTIPVTLLGAKMINNHVMENPLISSPSLPKQPLETSHASEAKVRISALENENLKLLSSNKALLSPIVEQGAHASSLSRQMQPPPQKKTKFEKK